jgi:serine protease Do
VPLDRRDNDGDGPIQQGRLGIQGKTLTPEVIDELGLKLKVPSGVFVAAVQSGSPAAEAGLSHGDVIHGLDGVEVKSAEELAQAFKTLRPGDYLIEVERNRRPIFLTLTIE